MATEKHPSPRRMPGDTPSSSPSMKNYIILLKEEDTPKDETLHGKGSARMHVHPEKRSHVLEAGIERSADFQRKLHKLLKEHGVADEVGHIAEPSIFPMVALTTTPKVASLIETLPEVEAVVADRDDIHLLP
jgi:hypothetical protein